MFYARTIARIGGEVKAIEASNLRKTYPGGVRALDGLNFAVEAGTIFGLLGPNGAGKSTTVKNLEMQAEIYGLTGSARRERVEQLLERFGLAEAAGRIAKTYSGVMQRRLDVALGLVQQPKVLFLDEPTTGLDPEARVELWREIERLAGEEEMTILLTTHYLEEADRLASRLAIVDRGHVVAEGTPEELKSELRGDTIQVELAESSNGNAVAALQGLPGLSGLSVEGRVLRARAENGAAAGPSVLAALEQGGLQVASATVARPSLDDVYLRHAGRSFQQADTDDREEAA